MKCFFAAMILILTTGCATHVIPPAHVRDPQAVYLTDYGRHSSLILPDTNGYDEYAFGDWNFFALGHANACAGLRAIVFGSSRGTLGWRHLAAPVEKDNLAGCKRIMTFNASQLRIEALNLELKSNFHGPVLHSDYSGLNHVRVDEWYWGLHNCNNVTADWLTRLGCEIRGDALTSKFILDPVPTP